MSRNELSGVSGFSPVNQSSFPTVLLFHSHHGTGFRHSASAQTVQLSFRGHGCSIWSRPPPRRAAGTGTESWRLPQVQGPQPPRARNEILENHFLVNRPRTQEPPRDHMDPLLLGPGNVGLGTGPRMHPGKDLKPGWTIACKTSGKWPSKPQIPFSGFQTGIIKSKMITFGAIITHSPNYMMPMSQPWTQPHFP